MLQKRFTLSVAATVAAAMLGAAALPAAAAYAPYFVLASTTSTQNSGLFGYMLPKFKHDTGIDVHVVAVGTGAALDMGKRCDAAGLLVHAKKRELKYVAAGYGVNRHDVMYNFFVIVGPASDPAHVGGMTNVTAALTKIYNDKAPFLSRGDDSGTNIRELHLWKDAGLNPAPASGTWYKETGAGMGSTLNTARAMGAYTLTDTGTWTAFKNKGDLKVLVEGDKRLRNQYGVMLVSPKRCPEVKTDLARKFEQWILSPHGQQVVASYRVHGKQLFHPDAKK